MRLDEVSDVRAEGRGDERMTPRLERHVHRNAERDEQQREPERPELRQRRRRDQRTASPAVSRKLAQLIALGKYVPSAAAYATTTRAIPTAAKRIGRSPLSWSSARTTSVMTAPRATVRRVVWSLSWPARVYFRRAPISAGKGFLHRHVLRPLLPPDPMTFFAHLVNGDSVELRYREALGEAILIEGDFESAEMRALARMAPRGTTAVDVGANVGMFSLVLAAAVGPEGEVWAVEPVAENVTRLRHHLQTNGRTNVRVFECAAGEAAGQAVLHLAADPAFHALSAAEASADIPRIVVPMRPLDDIWTAGGSPNVAVVKIDVEGAESRVLSGARMMLDACAPAILVELADPDAAEAALNVLRQLGYAERAIPGAKPWNRLFERRAQC